MTNKVIWSKPTLEVIEVRNAQARYFAQTDGTGALKTQGHQS